MKDDHRTANIDRDILKLIFDRVSLHTSTCLFFFCFLCTNILSLQSVA